MNVATMREDTERHMQNPQVGDRFSEMCTFWVWVVSVEPYLIVEESSPAKQDGEWIPRLFRSVEEFRAAYRYQHCDGYWVHFMGNRPVTR